MNELAKNLLLWVVIALVLMSVFSSFAPSTSNANEVPYSQFLTQVEDGSVAQVNIEDRRIRGQLKSGQNFTTFSPESDNKAMIGTLMDNDVEITGEPPDQGSFLKQILISWFPFLLLIGVWIYFMRQMQGGGGGRGAMSFGKSKARMMQADQIKITFADVAGVEEAKSEVQELVDRVLSLHAKLGDHRLSSALARDRLPDQDFREQFVGRRKIGPGQEVRKPVARPRHAGVFFRRRDKTGPQTVLATLVGETEEVIVVEADHRAFQYRGQIQVVVWEQQEASDRHQIHDRQLFRENQAVDTRDGNVVLL